MRRAVVATSRRRDEQFSRRATPGRGGAGTHARELDATCIGHSARDDAGGAAAVSAVSEARSVWKGRGLGQAVALGGGARGGGGRDDSGPGERRRARFPGARDTCAPRGRARAPFGQVGAPQRRETARAHSQTLAARDVIPPRGRARAVSELAGTAAVTRPPGAITPRGAAEASCKPRNGNCGRRRPRASGGHVAPRRVAWPTAAGRARHGRSPAARFRHTCALLLFFFAKFAPFPRLLAAYDVPQVDVNVAFS